MGRFLSRVRWAQLGVVALSVGCATVSLRNHQTAALPAIAALQQGRFDEAEQKGRDVAGAAADNPYLRLVSAIARYKRTTQDLARDGETLVVGSLNGRLNQRYLGSSLREAENELARVDEDLAVVARHPGFSVDLCIACWEVDWNLNGRVDDRDRRLFQVERDAAGEELPEDDPRRTPTFRFDDGDVAWARAFVSFQRAAIDLLLAYDWSQLGSVFERRGEVDTIVFPLIDRDRVAQARARVLEGLDFSDASRVAYLAETDDEREWVPSPRQKSHPLPLPVDQGLYDTWEGVVRDVRQLVKGQEGLFVADILDLAEIHPSVRPKGYLSVGTLLDDPKDITIHMDEISTLSDSDIIESLMRSVLGRGYVDRMTPSPLPRRLLRMKREIDDIDGELGRKLRYLLWIN